MLEFPFINPANTKPLVIGAPCKEIEPVTVAKDLGVYVDQTVCYTEHGSKLVSSCVYIVQINRIKHLLDSKTLLYN